MFMQLFGSLKLVRDYLIVVKLLQKIKNGIDSHKLITRSDSILAALSGGPDSVALLHILNQLRKSNQLTLTAVYINHQIRPRAAKKEEKFCQELCDRLNIELIIVREDIPALAKKRKVGLEEAGRDFRYATFEKITNDRQFQKIALGHHADDNTETILFRILRGTGRKGLCGIPRIRGRIIRPLLDIKKAELLKYLDEQQLDYCQDLSNRSKKYSRNKIRSDLLPLLRKGYNPKIDDALLALAENLEGEEIFLQCKVDSAFVKITSHTPGGKLSLDLKGLKRYPVWFRHRLLRHCLKVTCQSIMSQDKVVIERLERIVELENGSVSLPGRFQAEIAAGKLYLFCRKKRTAAGQFQLGNKLNLDWPSVTFTGKLTDRTSVKLAKRRRSNTVQLDYEKLVLPLSVRTIEKGDRFTPLGMTGSKKIGDFLTDIRFPKVCRDECLVLEDKKGIVWLVGFEISESVKIVKETKKVLTVVHTVRKETESKAV